MLPLKKMLICTTILSLTLPTVSSSVRAQEDWCDVAGKTGEVLTTYCTNLKNELSTTTSLQDNLAKMTCDAGGKVVPFFLTRLLSTEKVLSFIDNIQENLKFLNGFCEHDSESDGCTGFLQEKSTQGIPADTLLDFATHLKEQAEALNATALANEIKANVRKDSATPSQHKASYISQNKVSISNSTNTNVCEVQPICLIPVEDMISGIQTELTDFCSSILPWPFLIGNSLIGNNLIVNSQTDNNKYLYACNKEENTLDIDMFRCINMPQKFIDHLDQFNRLATEFKELKDTCAQQNNSSPCTNRFSTLKKKIEGTYKLKEDLHEGVRIELRGPRTPQYFMMISPQNSTFYVTSGDIVDDSKDNFAFRLCPSLYSKTNTVNTSTPVW